MFGNEGVKTIFKDRNKPKKSDKDCFFFLFAITFLITKIISDNRIML